jgi:hypothetical protein
MLGQLLHNHVYPVHSSDSVTDILPTLERVALAIMTEETLYAKLHYGLCQLCGCSLAVRYHHPEPDRQAHGYVRIFCLLRGIEKRQ